MNNGMSQRHGSGFIGRTVIFNFLKLLTKCLKNFEEFVGIIETTFTKFKLSGQFMIRLSVFVDETSSVVFELV